MLVQKSAVPVPVELSTKAPGETLGYGPRPCNLTTYVEDLDTFSGSWYLGNKPVTERSLSIFLSHFALRIKKGIFKKMFPWAQCVGSSLAPGPHMGANAPLPIWLSSFGLGKNRE